MLSYNGIIDEQKYRCMHANNEEVENAGVSAKGNGGTKNQIGTAKGNGNTKNQIGTKMRDQKREGKQK